MNDYKQESNDPKREKYSPPCCKRFVFETNDLIQASGENTSLGGDFSNDGSDTLAANAFACGDVGW